MRGYFGIGIEGASKPMNAGNLFRSAQGFGASFVFTINAQFGGGHIKSDTSHSAEQLPHYAFEDPAQLLLPGNCTLVGVELLDEAIPLPSFRHPAQAAYVLGPERGELSGDLRKRCEFVVRIPTRFCINVATAGAIVMYDRLITTGRFAERPVVPSAAPTPRPAHVHGDPPPPKAAHNKG